MITIAAQVRPGQSITFIPFFTEVTCEVKNVRTAGLVMGTDIPILRFEFVNPPRPIRAWEIPADREVRVT